MFVIDAKNIEKRYQEHLAVNNISFSVKRGTCFGLLGPNGAGKSTLMRMIYGKTLRDNPDKSRLRVFGFDPHFQARKIKTVTGVVPQDNNLDIDLSVEKNLFIYSQFYGMEKKIANERIEELLDFMELREKRKESIRSLSGGMQRRLVLARALLHSPKLLLLDEPTTGLDPQVRQLIWSKLHTLKKEGVAILLTTHYMEEAFDLCDDLIINNEGKKILSGHPKNIIQDNIEKYALQIFNTEKWDSLFLQDYKQKQEHNQPINWRWQMAEEHRLVYSNSMETLIEMSKNFSNQEFYLRQTTLEDVFLKATGRALHE